MYIFKFFFKKSPAFDSNNSDRMLISIDFQIEFKIVTPPGDSQQI